MRPVPYVRMTWFRIARSRLFRARLWFLQRGYLPAAEAAWLVLHNGCRFFQCMQNAESDLDRVVASFRRVEEHA